MAGERRIGVVYKDGDFKPLDADDKLEIPSGHIVSQNQEINVNDLANLDAAGIPYDNSQSGLSAQDLQDAIDEMMAEVDAVSADVVNNSHSILTIENELSIVNNRSLNNETSILGLNTRVDNLEVSVISLHENEGVVGVGDNRPTPKLGLMFFDSSISTLIIYNGSQWVNTNGMPV